jgi:NAD(P)H-flavin reductase
MAKPCANSFGLISLVSQNGKMSQHINHLKPGETLSFKGPIAKYVAMTRTS